MSIQSDFLARFPNNFTEEDVERYAYVFEQGFYECYWGGGYGGCGKEITLNLIACLIIFESQAEANAVSPNRGNQTSKSVGNVSESFADLSDKNFFDDFFGSNVFGRRFLFLTKSRKSNRCYFV